MLKLAKAALYEHPVQSMVLDPDDPLWKPDYFSDADIKEIKEYNAKSLPPLSQGLDEEMQLYDINWATGKEIYEFADNQKYDPVSEFDKKWLKESFIRHSELFFYDKLLQVSDWSEADLLHNVWAFVYRAFQDHTIRACLGERCSAAVALRNNKSHSLEAIGKRPRKAIGAKVDILFKASNKEIGSAEVGKDDGLPKLPKTLRDMLSLLAKCTTGFLMMGLSMEIVIVDVPHGGHMEHDINYCQIRDINQIEM